jgi:hypothetical protein
MNYHTCKSKLNLFFLEPYLQLLQRDFTNQVPSASSSSSFASVDTYLISFSFEHVTCAPSPNFATDLAFFREWFLWRLGGGGRPPPLATALHNTSHYLCFCLGYMQTMVALLSRVYCFIVFSPNYTRKNAQVVITNLQQTCSNAVPTTFQQDVFALLVPSLLTSCQRLVDNLLQDC